MKNPSEQINWLKNQMNKDKQELEYEKLKFIQEIKKTKKEEILPQPKKKLSLWQRIKKMAILSEGLGELFPQGKSVVVYSLNESDFTFVKTQVNDLSDTEQFKIDISGVEFIFLRDVLSNTSEDKI